MQWTSIVAIYGLIWIMCAFILMPFGIRTHEELGTEKIPGQADSAPANFQPGKLAIRASILAAILCALYVANYVNGWVTVSDLDFMNAANGEQTDPE